MSRLILEPITAINKADCLSLKVSADQQAFVASNERSLIQANDNMAMNPLGIILNTTMVGFTMWEPTREVASIHRLMIESLSFVFQETEADGELLYRLGPEASPAPRELV